MADTTTWVKTSDGERLHVQITGGGHPIVFVHEFGGDQRSWEPQVRFFSRRYKCITYNARGYPPSSVPESVDRFTQQRAVDDLRDVMNHLDIAKAHVVGLSMGGFAALHFGIQFPQRASSLVVASTGYGAEKANEEMFKRVSHEIADQFENKGAEDFSKIYALSASRIPFLVKDRRGWEDFRDVLGDRSSKGSALTMRGVQADRPSLFDMEDQIRNIESPVLIIVGDEDDHCLQSSLFLKRTIPASGLLVMPKTGHTCNLEEPDFFNRSVAEFLSMTDAGQWLPRDPRSDPAEVMKVD